MRLPVIDGNYSDIDIDAVREMVAYAMGKGVNYFDTAWGYHGGQSETAMGNVLKDYPRESFYLASKFPGFDIANMGKIKEIFEEQLRRCQVEYFDFYLFHNLCEANVDFYLDPQYGLLDFLLEEKRKGRIRYLGFSTHATIDTVRRFLDAFGEHMEFCQIQLNWLDYKMQNAKAKVDLLHERNIPIWVMEPLRGGKLVNLESEYSDILKALRPDSSVVEWAFRYLQSFPEVGVILSGMSNMEQLADNIAIFEKDLPLSSKEVDALYDVARAMTAKTSLPCTGCRYCTDYCPQKIDIPQIVELYNEHLYSGGTYLANMALRIMDDDKKPSACLGCRACEAVCPQNIKISEMMTDFTERLNKK